MMKFDLFKHFKTAASGMFFAFMLILPAGAAEIQFEFPNPGWHNTPCPAEYEESICWMPGGQNKDEYREMLVFSEYNTPKSAMDTLMTLFEKDLRKNGGSVPQILKQDKKDAMAASCSRLKNTCRIRRVFLSDESAVSILYINTMPHYSQNILGQWPNILSTASAYPYYGSGTVVNPDK